MEVEGIGRHYGLRIIQMPSFLLAGRKGAVFVGGEKKFGFLWG